MNTANRLYNEYTPIWRAAVNGPKTLSTYIRAAGAAFSVDGAGNMFVTKGLPPPGKLYPVFAAHLDTVFKGAPSPVLVHGLLHSRNKHGIGGDDKSGIVACLEIMRALPYCKVAFFTGEESGGIGARAANLDFFADGAYIVEVDRKGRNDCVVNSGGTVLCSDTFAAAFCPRGGYFQEADGVFTDVNVLKERGLSINMCNLSAGYHHAHTSAEFVILPQLETIIKHILRILPGLLEGEKHEYKPYFYGYGGYGGAFAALPNWDGWDAPAVDGADAGAAFENCLNAGYADCEMCENFAACCEYAEKTYKN
jgi:hypothetical protein